LGLRNYSRIEILGGPCFDAFLLDRANDEVAAVYQGHEKASFCVNLAVRCLNLGFRLVKTLFGITSLFKSWSSRVSHIDRFLFQATTRSPP
jgi:hypothetical protein